MTLLFLVVWLALFGLYLLLVGQASVPEIVAGGLCAAVAAGYHGFVHHVERRRFVFSVPWFSLMGRVIWAIGRDTLLVSVGLARVIRGGPSQGHVVRQSFEPGEERPQDAARRGVAVLAASLAPNSYVLEMLGGTQQLRLHRFLPSQPTGDKLWPV